MQLKGNYTYETAYDLYLNRKERLEVIRCDSCGIKCYYVEANDKSLKPNNRWNQVRVNGKWYIVDAQGGAFLVGTNTWSSFQITAPCILQIYSYSIDFPFSLSPDNLSPLFHTYCVPLNQ